MSHTLGKTSTVATILARRDGVVTAAKHRLLREPRLAMQRIWFEFDDGKLFLRGHVPSFYYKQLAQEAVTHLDEVREVVNEIEVLW